jgi:hypothetical protein
MPKRSNEFQQLVHLIEMALAPTGAKVTESVMESGREIDILIEWALGPHPIRVAVEAKHEQRPLDVGAIEQLIGKYHGTGSIPINKVIIVSRHGFTKAARERGEQVGFELLTLDEANRSDWTRLVPQQLAWKMPPHIDRVDLVPPVPKGGGKDPLADGRFVCKCHGHDQGSPLQWAEWLLRTQVLANHGLLARLDAEAGKRNGSVVTSIPLPMPNHILVFNDNQFDGLQLRVDIHYVNASGPVKWTTYSLSGNEGAGKTVDQMEAVVGGARMRFLFPDGPKSGRLTLRIDSVPPDGTNLPPNDSSEPLPFGTLSTTLRPADMPPARPMNHHKTDAQRGSKDSTPILQKGRVGRNKPCPCGSGKKYKNCCMRKTG